MSLREAPAARHLFHTSKWGDETYIDLGTVVAITIYSLGATVWLENGHTMSVSKDLAGAILAALKLYRRDYA